MNVFSRVRIRSRFGRSGLALLLMISFILGGFFLGLRSAIQKDKAYFWTKEIKIIAYHEYNLLKDWLQVKQPFKNKNLVDDVRVFIANDFTLRLVRLPVHGHTEKTAGFANTSNGELIKYEQANVNDYWQAFEMGQFIPNVEPTRFRGGGLKQIFQHQEQTLALISLKGSDACYFASLVNLTKHKEVFRAPCLPQVQELDFNSIGGAWAPVNNGILISLGTPSDDERISMLAQNPSSPYGKVLYFSDKRLVEPDTETAVFSVHSGGHRNPQGMVRIGDTIYSIDHGPKGGDEINWLQNGHNYGWPLYSLGSTYQGKPHVPIGDLKIFDEPLFSFVPSIAPSDITACPVNLAQRYAPLTCVLITSLRGMSLFVGLIDINHRIVSLESIAVNMRLREFVRLSEGHLAVSTDDYGVFEINVDELAGRENLQ